MKKRLILFPMLVTLTLWGVACKSSEEKKEPVATESGLNAQARSIDGLDGANAALAQVSILSLPESKATADAASFKQSAGVALATAKSVEGAIPEGHVLRITGHVSPGSTSPGYASGSALSTRRAKAVYDFFAKNGFPKNKLAYRGAKANENNPNLSVEQNRGVTFKIEPK